MDHISLLEDGSDHLTYFNVALGFSFICFDAILSLTLGLGVGTSLVVSAIRCVLQLSVMSLILDKVFAANNFWGVVGISLVLNILGAFEAVYNKSKRRFANMFPLILLSFIVATIPISLAGSAVMRRHPVWKPEKYIPVLGMILGNAVTAIGVGVSSILKEFTENKDKIETYLGMGATRFEACKPIAREALKLALLPTINQMSVIGLISIPGLMTGAIIGGSSVEQAAKLQMILMFMISASSALSVLAAMIFTFSVVFDPQHRIRDDRIYSSESVLSGGIRSVGKIGVLGWKSIKNLGGKERRP
ncbi:Conserved hypothetical protein CHP00245 [Phaffia rhodozyma]|uniref:Uncharacterized protein n=1 Tax=Phaffia rhodozyma TaxID=264483 RepID=A0A0F7SJT1_PHARH|nr:Conserved hypothetical protein CHP00245 [Phaffia rhodozyma]